MLSLSGIKAMLVLGGISRLEIDFDGEQKVVNAKYVFRGQSGTKKITYQEIIDSLTIGLPEAITCPSVDSNKQLE